LKVFSPLWHLDQESELRGLLRENFIVAMTAIAGEGLNPGWIGRIIDEHELDELIRLNETMGFNVAGEGGEYETLVLDCPLFRKRILLKEWDVVKESDIVAAISIKKTEFAGK